MDSTTQDISEIRIPPADEGLSKALADLGPMISGWKAAMVAAQEQLADQAHIQAKLQTQLESRTQEQTELKSRPEAQAKAQDATAEELSREAEGQAVLQAEVQQQAEAAVSVQSPSTTADDTAAAGDPPDWSSEHISKHIKVYGDQTGQTPEPEANVSPTDPSEDEALLASLDAETAKAIRVMRRISGGHKSVRELLEQYQANPTTARNEPMKKSWFRRGK